MGTSIATIPGKLVKSPFTMALAEIHSGNVVTGGGDHIRNNSQDPPVLDNRNELLTMHFQEIYSLVRKLESSLAITRQLENQELLRLTMTLAENKRLNSEVVKLRRNLYLNDSHHDCEDGKVLLQDLMRDEIEQCTTMSIVNLHCKYNELRATHQSILQTLTMRDKELTICLNKKEILQQNIKQLKKLLIQKDFVIQELCHKFLRLKERRDYLEEGMNKEIQVLQKSLRRAERVLSKHFVTNNSIIDEKLMKAPTSKQALLLHEIQRSNRLLHENTILKKELEMLKASR